MKFSIVAPVAIAIVWLTPDILAPALFSKVAIVPAVWSIALSVPLIVKWLVILSIVELFFIAVVPLKSVSLVRLVIIFLLSIITSVPTNFELVFKFKFSIVPSLSITAPFLLSIVPLLFKVVIRAPLAIAIAWFPNIVAPASLFKFVIVPAVWFIALFVPLIILWFSIVPISLALSIAILLLFKFALFLKVVIVPSLSIKEWATLLISSESCSNSKVVIEPSLSIAALFVLSIFPLLVKVPIVALAIISMAWFAPVIIAFAALVKVLIVALAAISIALSAPLIVLLFVRVAISLLFCIAVVSLFKSVLFLNVVIVPALSIKAPLVLRSCEFNSKFKFWIEPSLSIAAPLWLCIVPTFFRLLILAPVDTVIAWFPDIVAPVSLFKFVIVPAAWFIALSVPIIFLLFVRVSILAVPVVSIAIWLAVISEWFDILFILLLVTIALFAFFKSALLFNSVILPAFWINISLPISCEPCSKFKLVISLWLSIAIVSPCITPWFLLFNAPIWLLASFFIPIAPVILLALSRVVITPLLFIAAPFLLSIVPLLVRVVIVALLAIFIAWLSPEIVALALLSRVVITPFLLVWFIALSLPFITLWFSIFPICLALSIMILVPFKFVLFIKFWIVPSLSIRYWLLPLISFEFCSKFKLVIVPSLSIAEVFLLSIVPLLVRVVIIAPVVLTIACCPDIVPPVLLSILSIWP